MTKVVETLPKTFSFNTGIIWSPLPMFHFLPPPLSNVVITWQRPQSVFQNWKGGRWAKYNFFKNGITLDRQRLLCWMSQIFCPGLSTLDTQWIFSLLFRSRQENRFPAPIPKKPKISLYMYRNIFNTELNLSFGLPRTDTCARCDALDMALLSCSG